MIKVFIKYFNYLYINILDLDTKNGVIPQRVYEQFWGLLELGLLKME